MRSFRLPSQRNANESHGVWRSEEEAGEEEHQENQREGEERKKAKKEERKKKKEEKKKTKESKAKEPTADRQKESVSAEDLKRIRAKAQDSKGQWPKCRILRRSERYKQPVSLSQ